MNTLQMIHDCIKESTVMFCKDETKYMNTDEVAKKVNISRSVASKYLNQLVNEKALVKISIRPVVFYDCKIIEEMKNVEICEYEFVSIKEFLNYINNNKKIFDGFENVIGCKASLNEVIRKFKSNFKYSTVGGLSIIVSGEKGTGKKFLAKCLFNYAKIEKLIASDKKFYSFNCAGNDVDYSKKLFGKNAKDKNDVGCIEAADGGVLYISDSDNLDINSQNELASYLENGYIYRTIDKSIIKINVRIILATSKSPENVFCSRLLDAVGLCVKLPTLEERSLREKEKFIHKFLSYESEKMSKEILISNYAFNALVRFNYENNIDGVANAIKATCANANYSKPINKTNIEIYLYHLPEGIMQLSLEEDISEDKYMLKLNEIKSNLLFDNIMTYYNDILKRYRDYCSGTVTEAEFIGLANEALNKYCDYIIFEKNPYNQRINSYESIINNIFDIISNKYNVTIYSNCAFLMARIVYKLTYVDSCIQEWEEENKAYIDDIMNLFMNNFKNEYYIADEISEIIFKTLDIHLNAMNIIFLVMNIHFYNKSSNLNKIFGLIIAHGYSTASSIVDSANKLIGQQVFNAIDMPLDIKIDDVVNLVKRYINRRPYYDEIILLVDMGSLEEIGSRLIDSRNIRIGVINNVSTKVALDIGFKITSNMDMEEILSSTCNEIVYKYKIFENKKKDAIIFTMETGTAATYRVINVFKESVPKSVNIHFIPYDYYALLKGGKQESVFDEYNVLLITGTIEVSIDSIPFIGIEDLIVFKDIEKLNHIFSKYLDDKEMKAFNSNLLKNFSLENIMQSLTILNAKILLDFIERAIENLQRELTMILNSKIVLRLYIHISCLIERLVTKDLMIEYSELQEFAKKHSSFIEIFRRSFKELCAHYNVEIPLSEIAYLYDYIFSGCI